MTASAAHDASVRMDVVGDAAAAAGDDWPVASDADVEQNIEEHAHSTQPKTRKVAHHTNHPHQTNKAR